MSEGTQPTYPPSLFNEYTIAFEGSSLACVLYGVYVVIAGFNLALLRKKNYYILLTYSVVQLTFTTLYFAFSLYGAPAQSLGIFNIVSAYGPDALSPWPSVVVDVLFVLNTWMSDAFLFYRCYVVCMDMPFALFFPALLYITTVGASIAWLTVSSTPGAVYSTNAVQVAGIAYWTLSATTNICTSSFISARLWKHQRAVTRALGSHQGAFYLGYMAMTLESAMLYTAFAIVALIVFVLNSPLENVFFPVLGMVQAIAPSLIIYRIARGISFETSEWASTTVGSLRFASSCPQRSQPDMVGSGTMHASGESAKSDHDDGHSFIQQVKEDV